MSLSRLLFAVAACLMTAPGLFAQASPSVFDGKSTAGWKVKGDEKKSRWTVGVAALDDTNPGKMIVKDGSGELINTAGGGVDLYTEAKFGDCTVEVEFMIPKGSNSGIYLMGEYEVQVLDSYGKPDDKLTKSDLGGIYNTAAPRKNAAKKPGQWQKFEIEFQAPKFDGDVKTYKAKFVKVTLNGIVIHENVEMEKSTGGALTGKEAPTGPLLFQGDHGPVAYRNIKVTPKK